MCESHNPLEDDAKSAPVSNVVFDVQEITDKIFATIGEAFTAGLTRLETVIEELFGKEEGEDNGAARTVYGGECPCGGGCCAGGC